MSSIVHSFDSILDEIWFTQISNPLHISISFKLLVQIFVYLKNQADILAFIMQSYPGQNLFLKDQECLGFSVEWKWWATIVEI